MFVNKFRDAFDLDAKNRQCRNNNNHHSANHYHQLSNNNMATPVDRTPHGAIITGESRNGGGEYDHDDHDHGYGEIERSHVLYYEDSPDSSNGFVKLDKPRELYNDQQQQLLDFNKDHKTTTNSNATRVEITPSDDVAPLTGDDFKMDYAPSPQQFANELQSSNPHESLEEFLASTQKAASDMVNKGSRHISDLVGQFSPVEEESASELVNQTMYEEEDEEEEDDLPHQRMQNVKDEVVKHMEKVEAEAEHLADLEETTYHRRGPLTLGTPTTISSLSHEHHGGLVDMAHDIGSKVSDAAHVVGSTLVSAGEAISSKVNDAMGHHHHQEQMEKYSPEKQRFVEQPQSIVTVHANEVSGKIVDPATEAKNVLEEFASNTATKITNTTTDLLDFCGSSKDAKTKESSMAQKGVKSTEGSCCCINLKSLDPRVSDLIYWRDPRKSGVVFVGTFAFLLCLAIFPVISVAAYTGLIVILGTLSFRLYKMIQAFVQKTEQQNPFKPYLDTSVKLPEDRVHQQVEVVVQHIQNLFVQLRRLFLVENVVDTMKFAVLLWALTYVGACLSVMALVIIAFVGLFTIPKFYETYKTQIDHYHNIVHTKAKQVCDTVQEKIPQLKSKPHTE